MNLEGSYVFESERTKDTHCMSVSLKIDMIWYGITLSLKKYNKNMENLKKIDLKNLTLTQPVSE